MADRLKILVATDVDPTVVIGGSERALVGQLDELVIRGHHISVVTRAQAGRPLLETTAQGYNVVRYPMPSGMGAVDLIKALSIIRRTTRDAIVRDSPDILYLQQPLAGAGAIMARGRRAIPTVYQFHSPWPDEYRLRLPRAAANQSSPEETLLSRTEKIKFQLRRKIEGYALGRSHRILTLSRFMRERCRMLHDLPETRFSVIPGGVDVEHFRQYADRDQIRRRLRIGEGDDLILTVRNLEPRMGLANLIEAMPLILRTRPRAVCIIGGSGELAATLKAQVCAIGLEEHVRFTGFIPEDQLPEYYAAADLFVLPTTALEGFGMVTVEALACGTPVLGTPVGATPEILELLDSALLLRGVEPAEIARGCLAFLERPQNEKHELRSICRNYAVKRYSWPSVTARIEESLMEALNSTKSASQRIA